MFKERCLKRTLSSKLWGEGGVPINNAYITAVAGCGGGGGGVPTCEYASGRGAMGIS